MTTATEALTIRRATTDHDDFLELCELRRSVGWETTSVMGQQLAASQGQRTILVAVLAERIVGAITVEWDDPNRPDLADPDQYIAHVNDRCVNPAYQRRGIGSRLMQAAEDLARERGLFMLMAQVPESLPHVREEVLDRGYVYLYERDGFTVYRLALR